MANLIETASVCQKKLDEAAVAESCTSWMEANAGEVIYTGGKEIKIPSIVMQGLANYDTAKGYIEGDIEFKYQTVEMTQDRGRGFTLDANSTDETNYALNISAAMGEFQREYVIPEVDTYRISTIASNIIAAEQSGMTAYEEVLEAKENSLTVLKAIKRGIKALRQSYTGPIRIQINSDVLFELEIELAGKMKYVEMKNPNGIITKVPMIDNCPLIETPSDRMISSMTMLDGETEGQEAGGWTKGSTAVDINFMVLPAMAPIAVSKMDTLRIFDPATYQKATAWHADYRRYHDLWIKKNKLKVMYASFAGAKPTSV